MQTWQKKEIEDIYIIFMPKIHTAKYILTRITHAYTVQ